MRDGKFGIWFLITGICLLMGFGSAIAADTVKVGVVGPRTGTAAAINQAGSTDPNKVVAALEGMEMLGTRGTVQFGTEKGGPSYHHWMPPMLVIQWQDNEQVVLYPPEGATGKLKR